MDEGSKQFRSSARRSTINKRNFFTLFGNRMSMGRFEPGLPQQLQNHVYYKDIPYYFMEDYMHTLVSWPWWKLGLISMGANLAFIFVFTEIIHAGKG
eukprot:1317061-Amorphochlora_amoeboformis.AAC.1